MAVVERKERVLANRKRVLLIDEDSDFIEATGIILDESGFEVLTASSSPEGFRKVQEENPDVVVLDVMMESSDEGFATARKIRNNHHSNVPIIMLSSVTQATGYLFKPEEHPDYFPVNHFIKKPVSPSLLVQRIRTLLAEEDV